jgi:hypothetical protein
VIGRAYAARKLTARADYGYVRGPEGRMRLSVLVLAAGSTLAPSMSAFAQGSDWSAYGSRVGLFSIFFPSKPTVREIEYPTAHGLTLRGRAYTAQSGQSRYSVTVIDYTPAPQMHQQRLEACLAAKGDSCSNTTTRDEMGGALVYATWRVMQREGATVTHFGHMQQDLIEGHEVFLTNADGSRTHAAVHMHLNRVYIIEVTAPKGMAPLPFHIGMTFRDQDGAPVRYRGRVYSNSHPAPPRAPMNNAGEGEEPLSAFNPAFLLD